MTEQAEVLSAGDARARVAVLEAELAELRKRVCVPEGWTISESGDDLLVRHESIGSVIVEPNPSHPSMCATVILRALAESLLSAAPAPVERLEQEAVAPPVAWQHRKPIISDIHGNAKEWSDWIDGQGLAIWPHRPLYTTPQPAAPACTGKNCGSTDPNLHSADCFAEHEQAITPTAAQDVAGLVARIQDAAQVWYENTDDGLNKLLEAIEEAAHQRGGGN